MTNRTLRYNGCLETGQKVRFGNNEGIIIDFINKQYIDLTVGVRIAFYSCEEPHYTTIAEKTLRTSERWTISEETATVMETAHAIMIIEKVKVLWKEREGK